jgi:hypothetical protein
MFFFISSFNIYLIENLALFFFFHALYDLGFIIIFISLGYTMSFYLLIFVKFIV